MPPGWLEPRLAQAILESGTDAFRLSDTREVLVERYGQAALISHTSTNPPEWATRLDSQPGARGVRAIYSKRLVRNPKDSDRPVRLAGSGNDRFVARENGLAFHVDFSGGYSCGLFPDQRANRAFLESLQPATLLNLFAYTCAFSVAAARAGAKTTSVDLAKAALARGRENFALNGLSTDGHRFLAEDALDLLPRLARRGERYDVIVLDPPTFSRGRSGRIFRAERDLDKLLALAVACAAPGAWILLSTNCASLGPGALRTIARRICPEAALRNIPRPPDIQSGAQTLWIHTGGKTPPDPA